MKTLNEYINENLALEYNNDKFISINNYIQDFIYEVLTQSYDVEKLVNKLKKEFNISDSDIILSNYQSKSRNFKIEYKAYKKMLFIDAEKVNNILMQYGYYFSNFFDGYANIEPIFSENVTDIVQDECNGKIYKIVTKKTVNSISNRKGLITDRDNIFMSLKDNYRKGLYKSVKGNIRQNINDIINKQGKFPFRLNKHDLRYWASRLFFFAAKNKEGLKAAIEIINSQLQISNDNWRILEIDISNYNVNCYQDYYSESNNDNYVLLYINAFFPEKLIKVFTKDEFYELYKLS